MSDRHDRWIHFFYLQLSPYQNEVPTSALDGLDFKTVIQNLHDQYKKDNVIKKFRNNREVLRVLDAHFDKKNDIYHMQIRHTNKDGSDPAFADEEENKQRIAAKNNKEGNSTSSHVAISLKPSGTHLSFPVAIEKSAGLTLKRAQLEKLFYEQFKIILDKINFSYIDNSKQKSVKCWFHVRLEGMANINFTNDLDKGDRGLLETIELISYKYTGSFDQPKSLKRAEQIMRITPREIDSTGKLGSSFLRRIKSCAKKDGYEDMRIYYRRNGKTQSLNTSLSTDSGEFLLTKCEKFSTIESNPNLCPEKINPGLKEFVNAELKKCIK